MYKLLPFLRLFFIGFCALAMLLQTRVLLGLPVAPGFLDGYIFNGTVFGYHCTHPKFRLRRLAWLLGFAGAICLVMWVRSGGDAIAALLPLFFWLAYYGFRRPGNAGLRAQRFAKPLTVALAWAWVTVFLPVSKEQWDAILPMFLERGAFVFALALAYDVSDMAHDRLFGLTTLAHSLETDGSFRVIYLGLTVSGSIVCWAYTISDYSFPEAFSLLISLIFSAWWMRFTLQKLAWQPWHKVLIDGVIPLQCALVLLLR